MTPHQESGASTGPRPGIQAEIVRVQGTDVTFPDSRM
jgi:hypothetical protein